MLALVISSLALSACGGMGLAVTPDGCLTSTYTKDGQTYAAGPCFGEDGKVDRVRTSWSNDKGIAIRSTYHTKTGRSYVEYQTEDGGWVRWSSKSGVMLDGAPDSERIKQAENSPLAYHVKIQRENLPRPVSS